MENVEEFKEKLKEVADHFTLDTQLEKLREELAELKVEALRYQIDKQVKPFKLLEEVADVLNVLETVLLLLEKEGVTAYDYLLFSRNQKVQRTLERIKCGFYK